MDTRRRVSGLKLAALALSTATAGVGMLQASPAGAEARVPAREGASPDVCPSQLEGSDGQVLTVERFNRGDTGATTMCGICVIVVIEDWL